jgi:hypothetical protein
VLGGSLGFARALVPVLVGAPALQRRGALRLAATAELGRPSPSSVGGELGRNDAAVVAAPSAAGGTLAPGTLAGIASRAVARDADLLGTGCGCSWRVRSSAYTNRRAQVSSTPTSASNASSGRG